MAGEDHVLGAFAVAGRSVQVAAEQAGGLVRHQRPAVLGLADRLIAGRKVRNDSGTGQRVEGGGGQSAPQVFADLHAQNEAGHLAAAEEQGCTERHFLPADCHIFHLSAARGELALFVELAVVGQVGLGHKTQQLPAAQHSGAVVQLAVHHQRQTHQRDHIQLFCFVQQGAQSVQCALLQRALQEQIAAGVAGQAELGKHRQLHAAGGGILQAGKDLPGVICAVRHPQSGGESGSFQKTIFHRRISHPVFQS